MAVPAYADDVFGGGHPSVGVEVDSGYTYRDRDWDRDRAYRTEGFDRHYGVERCRTMIIRHSDGTTTRERRCRD